MIIRIKDGVAMLLDEKESETARKEKSQHYWILVKNGDDSWIIDEDKNKVRPFIRDYISRMPGSLEIKYLTFVSAIVSVLFFVCSLSWYTNDSEKKIDTLSTNIESAVKRMEETQKIFSKPSALPERITSTGSTNFATHSTTVTNPLSNASWNAKPKQ